MTAGVELCSTIVLHCTTNVLQKGADMTYELTLRQAGGSVCATLPKAVIEKYKLQVGDKAFLTETQDGILITPYDPDVEEALSVVADMSRKYRNAMRELAK